MYQGKLSLPFTKALASSLCSMPCTALLCQTAWAPLSSSDREEYVLLTAYHYFLQGPRSKRSHAASPWSIKLCRSNNHHLICY